MPFFYITVTPQFSKEELDFVHDLENLAAAYYSKNNTGMTVFFNSLKDINKIEILNNGKNENNFLIKLEIFIKKYNIKNKDNLVISLKFPLLFLHNEMTHVHNNNYKIMYNNVTMQSQLYKLIHIFYEDGTIRQLLNHQLSIHSFNKVIIGQNNEEVFILENKNLYLAQLNGKGIYEKIELDMTLLNNVNWNELNKYLEYQSLNQKLIKNLKKVDKLTKI